MWGGQSCKLTINMIMIKKAQEIKKKEGEWPEATKYV